MFQQLKQIDTAFKLVRNFCLFVMIICFAVCAFAIYKTTAVVKESHEQMYILADGKILQATASSRQENIPVEARDHIRMFHYYFFTLDPDDKVIQSNITKALYLADASAKRAYDNLKENSYYANIISGNISQSINIDSVQVNTAQYPFYWRCYATEKITRPSSIVIRNLITEGYLRDVSRSDNNPHGFLIERWNTIENKDIKIEPR
ncbi:conjugative transposon protein TraK [Ilyomonas limi]|uniref:Conjugative transposon protein TraK n=1 Tax=Ilyomonas limi TaxID=2575867 RepID=A0A4U3KQW6_9BACT|nr:conjugative transposon protein TraK [Ilyomonas limi]TKK64708.1 conjugative transposon protein TraK [Ilyomonas limi]